ncbi:MAG: transposase [Bacteroidales bacterium]|nr:transposase [Bacteroidales bacterium]
MEILEQGYYYHIYNRGNNKEKLFLEHSDYAYFLLLFKKYIHEIANVFCYCLMPNHFHFLIRIKEIEEIFSYELKQKSFSQSFSNYFNAYTKYFNHKYSRNGSLFQERFKRKRVENEIYLKYLIHYIHMNPVHHEIVENFESYTYSSYQTLLRDHPTLLERENVIDLFEDKENYIYTHRQKARLVFIQNLIKGD